MQNLFESGLRFAQSVRKWFAETLTHDKSEAKLATKMKTQNIIVAGRSFKIKSDADPTYLQSLADTITKKFESMSGGGGRQDQEMKVMAMVAIGLLDELNESSDKYNKIRKRTREFSANMVTKIDALLARKSL